MKVFKNFINGAWVEPSTGAYFENRNPADVNDVVGKFPLSNAEDVNRAVVSAKRGFDLWKRVPAPQTGQVISTVPEPIRPSLTTAIPPLVRPGTMTAAMPDQVEPKVPSRTSWVCQVAQRRAGEVP